VGDEEMRIVCFMIGKKNRKNGKYCVGDEEMRIVCFMIGKKNRKNGKYCVGGEEMRIKYLCGKNSSPSTRRAITTAKL
jgi:hypothetical protein